MWPSMKTSEPESIQKIFKERCGKKTPFYSPSSVKNEKFKKISASMVINVGKPKRTMWKKNKRANIIIPFFVEFSV